MDNNLKDKLTEVKPVIRSILLALGKRATEKEFRREYYNNEGESFNKILFEFCSSFFQFMRSIPDVCRVYKINTIDGDEIQIEHVSTVESSHMDALTVVNKKRKRSKPCPARFRTNYGMNSFHRRPQIRPSPSFAPPRQSFNFNNLSTFNKLPTPPSNGKYSHSTTASSYKLNSSKPYSYTPSQHPMRPPPGKIHAPARPLQHVNTSISSLPLLHLNKPRVVYKASAQETQDENIVLAAADNFVEAESSSSSTFSENSYKSSRMEKSSTMEYKEEEITPRLAPTNPFAAYMKTLKLMREKRDEGRKPEFINTFQSQMDVTELSPPLPTASCIIRKNLFSTSVSLRQKKIPRAAEVFDIANFVTSKQSIAQARMREIKCLIFIQIEIIELSSPSQFVFLFNQSELDVLLTEMSVYYKSLNESHHLAIQQLLPGMAVAVFNDDKWQRAEVICICGSDAFVLFVDAGYRKYIGKNKLRYLEKTFAMSARKCYKGSLIGVKPSNDEPLWSAEAMEFMSKKLKVKLYATVKGLKDGLYQLSLYDDAVKRTKVSDYMISQKFAEEDIHADLSMNAILV